MKFPITLIVVYITILHLAACNRSFMSQSNPVIAYSSSDKAVRFNVLSALGNGLMDSAATKLSADDRKRALEAEYQALEYSQSGQVVNWKGASGDRSGEVIAAQPYQVGSQNCRQYTHSFTIDAIPQTVRGSACRNANGSWTPLT